MRDNLNWNRVDSTILQYFSRFLCFITLHFLFFPTYNWSIISRSNTHKLNILNREFIIFDRIQALHRENDFCFDGFYLVLFFNFAYKNMNPSRTAFIYFIFKTVSFLLDIKEKWIKSSFSLLKGLMISG